MLLNDTQVLHASTQQLRQLRDAVAQEKQAVIDAKQKLDEACDAVHRDKATAAAHIAAAATAEKKVDELRIKLSEKRAQLSNEMVKVGSPWTSCCGICRIMMGKHRLQDLGLYCLMTCLSCSMVESKQPGMP